MEAYTSFAEVYDTFMDNVPYEQWADSESMLELAMEKRIKSGHDILYLLQDMQSFELYGTVKAVISVCDSLNYIKDDAELTEVFKLVNNYLDPQGIFIFDFNTEYKYREILGDRVIAEEREECSFIWENYYKAEDKMNEYQLTLFVQSQEDPKLYQRYQEVHQHMTHIRRRHRCTPADVSV